MNSWKEIWNNKGKSAGKVDLEAVSMEEGFAKLKQLMGITVIDGDGPSLKGFLDQFRENLREMCFSSKGEYMPTSFFDVGCGTGAYLFFIRRMFGESVFLGGTDYSEAYIDIARQVLNSCKELYSGDAEKLDTEIKYDVVYSRSIFQYFSDPNYARTVVEKMLEKSNHSVAILDVHDLKQQESFLAYRRSVIEDYDNKYANTKHLFLPKEMFMEIAEEHSCSIKFAHSELPGYWNSKFTYDVYLFK